MTPQEAFAAADQLDLLDVREDDEWAAAHVPGAVHIPMHEVPARAGELDPARRLAVICRSGNRSAKVTQWLRGAGFDAHNVEGGLQQWAASGLPVSAT